MKMSLMLALLSLAAITAHAADVPTVAPTQEQVLRSISENLGEPTDGGKLLAALCAFVAVVILLVLLQSRRVRSIEVKVLNHPGKLMKEVTKAVDLSPMQVKQLKSLASRLGCKSPLTLLLCPSIAKTAVSSGDAKAPADDRAQAISQKQ